MAFIVINDDTVTIKKNLKQLNKKLKTAFTREEFKKYNSDYVLQINNDDLDFKRDCHELDKVFINKLYRKDAGNLINYGFYVIMLIVLIIVLTSVSGVSGMLQQLVEYMEAGV